MGYTVPSPQPVIAGLDALVSSVCAKYAKAITSDSIAYLTAHGQVVQLTPTPALNSGTTTFPVWCSCVPQDDPGTPGLQLFSLVIAGRKGKPWLKPNGEPVCSYFWHSVPDTVVASTPLQDIRKGLILFLLGEPQVANPPIIEDALDTTQTSLSIVTKANAALQMEAAPGVAL